MKVVLDTNVLVSGVMYPAGTPGLILESWRRGQSIIVLSQYILDEMARVLPKLKRNPYSLSETRNIAHGFTLTAQVVEPVMTFDENIRDKTDLPVLGTLLASRADYLITGDKDLLALAERYPIVTPAAFWQRHGS